MPLHKEAFCLMKYATDDGSEVEWLWNSRDGVTPFIIRSRTGKEMHHVDFHLDRPVPHYQPLDSERIFVDLTPERAELFARRRIERYWNDMPFPMSQAFETQEQALDVLVKEMLRPGAPDIIEGREYRKGS